MSLRQLLQSFHHVDGWTDFVSWSMFKTSVKSGVHSLQWFCAAYQPLKALCGGLTLAGGQVPTEAALSLPSSAGQGREYNERLVDQDKDRERSFNYCHRQNRLGLGK